MAKSNAVTPGKILVAVSFAAMVTVNALANILPINGIGTGAVSDSYPNLFAPAGITFAIWGLIYLLLLCYTIYQFGTFPNKSGKDPGALHQKIGFLFTLSSIANTIWIFAWHYSYIGVSMLLMLVILICLVQIVQAISGEDLSLKDKLLIRLPFSVYFGWITVATIANATTLLVDTGWDGFGIAESVWTVLIIAVGLLIAIVTMLKNRDIAYGLVIIWAYAGILIKHFSEAGFAGKYMEIIVTVIISIALLVIAGGYILFSKSSKRITSR